MKLGTKFAVADYTLAPQPEVLRRAEVLYDSFMLSRKVCLVLLDRLCAVALCCLAVGRWRWLWQWHQGQGQGQADGARRG